MGFNSAFKGLNVFLFVSFPPLYLHTGHLHRLKKKIAIGHKAKFFRDNLVLTFEFLGGGEELEKGYTFFREIKEPLQNSRPQEDDTK